MRRAVDTLPMRPLSFRAWEDRQVAEPNQRSRFEAARSEIGIRWVNGFVEFRHGLLELGADTADE